MNKKEDKILALNALVKALICTKAGCDVEKIEVADNGDTAVIYFIDRGSKRVNIALDSAIAAIVDVCKALM